MGLPITRVNIVLNTRTVSRAGFGTPLFISTHKAFTERVRTYTSMEGVAEDFSVTDAAYKAANSAFSQSPSIEQIKIGRRASDAQIVVSEVNAGDTYQVKITIQSGESVTAQYVAQESDTVTIIATALKDAIVAASAVNAVVVATSAAGIITLTSSADYQISKLQNVTSTLTPDETVVEAYNAIKEIDGDFYFVSSDDKLDASVLALAAAVESDEKLHFFSTKDVSCLTSYTELSTDILAKVKQFNYDRTAGVWSQESDNYPELAYVGCNAVFSPDESAVVWDGLFLTGVPSARVASGAIISATQQLNLDSRNASYVINTRAGDRILGGKVASGLWIDEMQIKDCLSARLREACDQIILNQKGKKIPNSDEGRLLIEAAMRTVGNVFINSNALANYRVDLTQSIFVPSTRTLSNVIFDGILDGAIIRLVINGELTNG